MQGLMEKPDFPFANELFYSVNNVKWHVSIEEISWELSLLHVPVTFLKMSETVPIP
jgi:hypothetical protein